MKIILWGFLPILLTTFEGSAGEFRPVTSIGQTNAAGAAGSFNPVLSRDGRFVVFVSHANNLVTNDDLTPYLDVFVRDLANAQTTLVSVNTTGVGGGNADANYPSISSNGQFVAFASAASNLVNNDMNDAPDIFVRNLVSGVTTLVSVDLTGNSSAAALSPWTRYRLSSNPLISGDGNSVFFDSLATNLVALSDTNQMADIFARDLRSNTTSLVSVNSTGTSSGNGNSQLGGITPDGRFVVFVSTSTDLVSGATNSLGDIYVRDLQSATTLWASANAGQFLSNSYRCFSPVISEDGRFVAFKAASSADTNVLVFRHDLQANSSSVLTSNSWSDSMPQISTDGRFVAAESGNDVYLWDVQAGTNVLVSVNSSGTGPGNQVSHTPVMTRDGSKVVFLSVASDLAINATNGISQVFVRDLAAGATRLVSVNLNGLASAGEIDVTLPGISDNGRRIVFESKATDLVANDLNRANDVFARDLDSETTQLISQRHTNLPESTASAFTTLFSKSVSANGNKIAFTSYDSTLVPGDDDEFPDTFVRDVSTGTVLRLAEEKQDFAGSDLLGLEPALSANGRYLAAGAVYSFCLAPTPYERITRFDMQNGTNEPVSISPGGGSFSIRSATAPAISSDGNLIAFQSASDDLVPGLYLGSRSNIVLRNMRLGTNQLVSIRTDSMAGGNGGSAGAIFSPDDRWVVFSSIASDLTTQRTDELVNLFARDLLSNTTRVISVAPDGNTPLGYLRGAVFSADSSHLAFVSSIGPLAVYDFVNRTSIVACAACDNPSISADGRWVAFETPATESAAGNIMLKDLVTGLTTLISHNRLGTGGGNGNSISPLLSWDARYVLFASKASDLVDNDTNGASDIFLWDRVRGTTLLVSINWQGTGSGNGPSSKPVLAADGRTVVFQSFASDLVPGDYNNSRDVFMLHLGGADTDGDGMDDDWEMAYFGTLARDGTGDFDGDGQTDLQEFLAGTDPTNSGSVLRVMTLTLAGGGSTRLLWAASPGKSYRVQFKDNLADSWTNLPGSIIANGTTASYLDNSASAADHRFYRAVLSQ